MAYWWGNPKQTREHEVHGGYLWSPMRNRNAAFNQTYENMRHVRPGDIVFSYADGRIGALGRVTVAAMASPKPEEFGNIGHYWSNEGWLVEVDFVPAPRTVSPRDHIETIGPLLPARHSPLQATGHGNQGVYLAAISDSLGLVLMTLTHADQLRAMKDPMTQMAEQEIGAEVIEDIERIKSDETLLLTEREQLARARIGQGLFRKRVLRQDQACRVTGVADTRVLIASHIKPWKEASNEERLTGNNGILLSPHVDALFDDRLITFDEDGRIHVHLSLDPEVLDRWSIDTSRRVESFRPEQRPFLEHHRRLFALKIA